MNHVFHSIMLGAAMIFSAAGALADVTQSSSMSTRPFEFISHGHRLSGFFDAPASGIAHAMIVIIPGYGQTEVAGKTSYDDLRNLFTGTDISTLIWDKPGCGNSEGTFDADQPVASSAEEVLEAISHAQQIKLPGSQKIGGASAAPDGLRHWRSNKTPRLPSGFP